VCSISKVGDTVNFTIETERETDGRWIAEVAEIPGALVYGATEKEAVARVKALARSVVDECPSNGK
jgi:predicted RNase H-like HicB family nuclease